MGTLIRRSKKHGRLLENGEYCKSCYYTNTDAVENLIWYITRTRVCEDKANELLGYGVIGACSYMNLDVVILQFKNVQLQFGIGARKGKRMYHEVFVMRDEIKTLDGRKLSIDELMMMAYECAMLYYNAGYQVMYAVHIDQTQGFHIHFAVNSVSFINGMKFHTNPELLAGREAYFNEILSRHLSAGESSANPFY